jgi:hypothetical protein
MMKFNPFHFLYLLMVASSCSTSTCPPSPYISDYDYARQIQNNIPLKSIGESNSSFEIWIWCFGVNVPEILIISHSENWRALNVKVWDNIYINTPRYSVDSIQAISILPTQGWLKYTKGLEKLTEINDTHWKSELYNDCLKGNPVEYLYYVELRKDGAIQSGFVLEPVKNITNECDNSALRKLTYHTLESFFGSDWRTLPSPVSLH